MKKITVKKTTKAKVTRIEQIKTFEDACRVEGLDPKQTIPDFSCFPSQDQAALSAHAQLVIIARAVNRVANKGKEWQPDWNDVNQWKYYPWFYLGGSAGFRFDDYGTWSSLSYVGSRLCFISREAATYAGQQFEGLYKQYFVM